jgi:hypothetical protein
LDSGNEEGVFERSVEAVEEPLSPINKLPVPAFNSEQLSVPMTPLNDRELVAKISEKPPTLPRKAWNGMRNMFASFMTPKEEDVSRGDVSPDDAGIAVAETEEEEAPIEKETTIRFVAEKDDSLEHQEKDDDDDEKTIIAGERNAKDFEQDSLDIIKTSVIKNFS